MTPWFVAPLSHKEYRALAQQLPADRQVFTDLAVYTGARLSEIERLTLDDIDLDRECIRIINPKTGHESRAVPLHPLIAKYLLPTSPMRQIARAEGGLLVRPWPRVTPDFFKACMKANISARRFGALRETFKAWHEAAGVDAATIAKWMGRQPPQVLQ